MSYRVGECNLYRCTISKIPFIYRNKCTAGSCKNNVTRLAQVIFIRKD